MVRRRKGQPMLTLIEAGNRLALEPRGWEHFA
jgi:hypothetical protein